MGLFGLGANYGKIQIALGYVKIITECDHYWYSIRECFTSNTDNFKDHEPPFIYNHFNSYAYYFNSYAVF